MSETISFLPGHVTCFPCVDSALKEPDGLLAVGGNLGVDTLLLAYQGGIFPWFNQGDPLLWWSPSQRMVFTPGKLHLSRSLLKLLRKNRYQVTFDHNFSALITACASCYQDNKGTWITADMIAAYTALHLAGYAHCVEVWRDGKLVGGLYGVALGRVFFAESMFSKESNASKIALAALSERLTRWHFQLVDCQNYSAHLESLGAGLISRERFMKYLNMYCSKDPACANWHLEWQWHDG